MPDTTYAQYVLMLARRRWRAVLLAAVVVSVILALLYARRAEPHLLSLPLQQVTPRAEVDDASLHDALSMKADHPDTEPEPARSPLADKLKRSGVIGGDGDGLVHDPQEIAVAAVPEMYRKMVEEHQQWKQQGQQWDRLAPPGQVRYEQRLGQLYEPYIPTRRVVHFDLKGAPPTVRYLSRLFPLIQGLGGTHILMEWEDMFPFSGPLKPVAAKNHYSRQDVTHILEEAAKHGLQVIPLVQTFGHLEPFLKLEPFAPLREVPEQPAAICPSRNESLRLVEMIIDQVMSVHQDAEFLHVGCDEVYHMGLCDLCRRKDRDELFLQHVNHVATYVRSKYKATPLIWHDMMTHMSAEEMKASGIGKLVEPMVWVYAEDVDRFAGRDVFEAFGEVFPRIWAASAYKGAFGETLVAPPLQRHIDNNINWLSVMQRETPRFRQGFAGLVITGWQRFDHFAVLCELLPAAVPSLAIALATATHGFFNSSLRTPVNEALKCRNNDDEYEEQFLSLDEDAEGFYQFSYCRFPGADFFKFLGRYHGTVTQVEEFLKTATESKGWLTGYNVARNYTNPFRVDELLEMFTGVKRSLTSSVRGVKAALKDVVDRYTIAEWVEQKIYPYILKMDRVWEDGEALKQRRVWERRPLPMLAALAQYGLDVTETEGAPRAEVTARPGRSSRGKVLPVRPRRKMARARSSEVPDVRKFSNGHGGVEHIAGAGDQWPT